MRDFLGMHVLDTFDYLSKQFPSIIFTKITMLFEPAEKLASLAETK